MKAYQITRIQSVALLSFGACMLALGAELLPVLIIHCLMTVGVIATYVAVRRDEVSNWTPPQLI